MSPGQISARPPSPHDLYASQASYVWSTVRRLGIPPADVEDVAQEVFVTAFRKLPSFDPARPVQPWLFGIAVNLASHHQRWWTRRREVPDDGRLARQLDVALDPEALAVDRQEQALLFAALQKLRLERRAVLILHEIDGRPIPEVAETLEIPLNTAYSRLRLGRLDLAAAVQQLSGGVA